MRLGATYNMHRHAADLREAEREMSPGKRTLVSLIILPFEKGGPAETTSVWWDSVASQKERETGANPEWKRGHE